MRRRPVIIGLSVLATILGVVGLPDKAQALWEILRVMDHEWVRWLFLAVGMSGLVYAYLYDLPYAREKEWRHPWRSRRLWAARKGGFDRNAPRSTKIERDTDYTDEDRELWEHELRHEIYAAQAMLRIDSYAMVNWKWINWKAETLGIDRERVHRIVNAAQAGFDWDSAVSDMERNGMSRQAAEEVTERLAIDITAARTLERDLSDVRERAQLIWAIVALVAIISAGIFAALYWSWLSVTADSVYQCLTQVV